MEGQAERQPLSTSDAAAAIESLLGGTNVAEAPDEPETEEVVDEGDAEVSEEPESEEGDEQPDEPEPLTLETLDDIAKALEVDPNDLLANLKMKIKVNGEERLVSLKEAQAGHQMEADYRRKTMELAEQRKAVEAEYAQRQSLYQQQAVEAAQMLQLAEQAIVADMQTPQMSKLREENPAEWNARMFEGQQKLQHLGSVRQHAAQQWQQQQQVAAQEQQRHFQTYLASEHEALESALSGRGVDWTQDQKAKLSAFLVDRYGFSADDVGKVYNHRLVLMALDAMGATEAAKKAELVKAKVKAVPKMQAPGKPVSKLQVQKNKLTAMKGALKKTGKLRDAAAVIESLM